MTTLDEFKQQNPAYADTPDDKLAEGLYKKFYADRMSKDDFYKQIDYAPFDPSLETLKKAGSVLPGQAWDLAKDTFRRTNYPLQYITGEASPKDDAAKLWHVVTHLDDYTKGIREKGFSGFFGDMWDDIKKRYGTPGKAQRTFETDPLGFLMDATAVGGGASAVGKTVAGAAKIASRTVPGAVARVAGLEPETLRTAATAGRLGGPEAAEYQAAVKGRPTVSGRPVTPLEADVGAPQILPEGQRLGAAKVMEAQQALGAQREAAVQRLEPFARAGSAVREAGWLPEINEKTLAKAGAGYLAGAPWWASPALSPGLMGKLSYGLGATGRGLSRTIGAGPSGGMRAAIAVEAGRMMRNPETKRDLSNDERKTLRAAQRDDAPGSTMLAAAGILRRVSPMLSDTMAQYGGMGADTSMGGARALSVPQTPGPGEASKPGPAGPAQPPDQQAVPGSVPAQPPAEPTGPSGPSIINALRGTVKGLSEADPIGEVWDMIKTTGTLPKRLMDAVKRYQETGEYDPQPAIEAGLMTMGGTAFSAPKGALGAGPALRAKPFDPSGIRGLSEHLTPEELATVTARNVDSLKRVFGMMPSADEMAAVAYSGRAKRGWYKQSAQALIDTFGNDDAPRFASLLAALSPQTSVQSNTENALRTWLNWTKAGRPTDTEAIKKVLAQSVQGEKGAESVLEAWVGNSVRALQAVDPTQVQLSGPKVNSFMLNLRNFVHEVTNDAWMARYTRVPQEEFASAYRKDPTSATGKTGYKSPGYLAMSAATRRAAKRLSELTGDTWTPAEIQETIWSWAKTLREKATSAEHATTVTQLLRAGNISHAEIADTPDFAVLFTQGLYRNILEQAGYGATIKKIEAELGRSAARGRASAVGSPARAEGGPFTEAAYRRHLQRAGRRLDRPIEE